MYKINISYQTGDSFGTQQAKDEVGHAWADLDTVKANLKRIEEHYAWQQYEGAHHWYGDEVPTKPDWLGEPPYKYGSIPLILLKDPVDGVSEEIVMHHPFWTGYFETLYGASIETIAPDTDDMKFTVH